MRILKYLEVLTAAQISFLAGGALAAERYSWFDDSSASGPAVFAPLGARALSQPGFGFDLYRSDAARSRLDEAEAGEESVVRFYGEIEAEPVSGGPASAGTDFGFASEPAPARRLSVLTLSWQHRLDTRNLIGFSAGYGGGTADARTASDIVDRRAALSWTGAWGEGRSPRLTGAVFVGGEAARDEAQEKLGRRYYGFAVGGEMTFPRAHTPYVSFQMQRAPFGDDPLALSAQSEYRSLLTAGWKWQVQRGLSLQAEASYGYSGRQPRLYDPESSRLFFGTRYDFK